MKNIFKKSLFIVMDCLLSMGVMATDVVAVSPGTYSLSSAPAPTGSKKFNMYQNIYYGRNGGGLTVNGGLEVKNGSMFALKISQASTIKFKVHNSKTKSITDKWSVKAISDVDFAGIVAQFDNQGTAQTYYSNSGAEISSLSVTHTGVTDTYTNETSALQPGCYGFYLSNHSADGDFVAEIIIASTTPSEPVAVTGVSLNKNTLSLEVSKSEKLTATVEPSNATDKTVSWSSDKESVATVAQDGTVTAVAAGTAKITVTTKDGNKTASCDVTVTAPVVPVPVSSVQLNKTTLDLEAGNSETLIVTVKPDDADDKTVTWESDNGSVASVDQSGKVSANAAGSTTITVTSNADATKKASCTVNVTAPTVIVNVTGVTINPKTLSLDKGKTGSLSFVIAPADATNKAVTWGSDKTSVATVNNGIVTAVAVGEAKITVTTVDGSFSDFCTVTVNEPVIAVTSVTLSNTALSLDEGKTAQLTATVLPDGVANKNVSWISNKTSVATVDANGKVTAVAKGTATITATSEADPTKKAECVVTVKEVVPVPSTDLTLHVPEIYEAKTIAGGYGGTLSVVDGREYEVYYMTRDGDSKFCIATTSADKTTGITTLGSSDYSCTANDGWFKFAGTGWSSASDDMQGEFGVMARRLDMDNTCEFTMHLRGFDQFALVARDKKKDTSSGQTKPEDNRYLEVYIDNVLQPLQFNTTPTIRRYDVSSGEHVVRVIHHGSEKSAMYAFSLRIAQEPRTKWLKGNDSTQTVMQTAAPAAVYYFTKYNAMGETKLEWENNKEATGITLVKKASSALGDTLMLSGTAQCQVGEYKYNVISYYQGNETSRVSGKLKVATSIRATTRDSVFEAYTEEEMDEITYSFQALSGDSVRLVWKGVAPAGVAGKAVGTKYVIGGTPDKGTAGTYDFTVSVGGGNSIEGQLVIRNLDMGTNPVIYLHKNSLSYEKDDVYKYLTTKASKVNLIPRKASVNGVRADYSKYNWILISEDVDADNAEVLALIKGEAAKDKPILNLKSFTYSAGRLGWGRPNNGSLDTISQNGSKIYIQREKHPIFKAAFTGKDQGTAIQILEHTNGEQGVMPVAVSLDNTFCLATAYTRNNEDYYTDGVLQTAIHEVPSAERNNAAKYICLPLASNAVLSADGKKLMDEIIKYLTNPNTAAGIELPTLKMTKFSINNVEGVINADNTIEMAFDVAQGAIDLTSLKPVIELADPKYTYVTPASGEEVDFQYSTYKPVEFVVSDYIRRAVYMVKVRMYNSQDIEEVYTAGEWVNIFDIYGRKVTTTNQDVYSMDLPRGMYIIVTESGNSLKIMR